MKLRNLIAVSDFFSCLKNLESNWESGSYPGKKKKTGQKNWELPDDIYEKRGG